MNSKNEILLFIRKRINIIKFDKSDLSLEKKSEVFNINLNEKNYHSDFCFNDKYIYNLRDKYD
jgi:hypothetical protein